MATPPPTPTPVLSTPVTNSTGGVARWFESNYNYSYDYYDFTPPLSKMFSFFFSKVEVIFSKLAITDQVTAIGDVATLFLTKMACGVAYFALIIGLGFAVWYARDAIKALVGTGERSDQGRGSDEGSERRLGFEKRTRALESEDGNKRDGLQSGDFERREMQREEWEDTWRRKWDERARIVSLRRRCVVGE